MPKPEYEFHEPTDQPWEPAGAPGFFQKILSKDSETGDYTRLARMEPGTDTSELGTFTHDFWEEVFIIRGSLTDLRLGCPALSDLFLHHLAELKQLERLALAGSSATDEGLKLLHGLTALRELDLTGTKVTAAGVEAFKKAVPKCMVLSGPAAK